jgi:hypothetical protein
MALCCAVGVDRADPRRVKLYEAVERAMPNSAEVV